MEEPPATVLSLKPTMSARKLLAGLSASGAEGQRFADALRDLRLDLLSALARWERPEARLKRLYRRQIGQKLDLVSPRGFNAKLQWLKLHDTTPLHARCADKLAVRDYVRETIPEADLLIPLLAVLDDASELSPGRIGEHRFVVKATHDSGSTQICTDRDSFDWSRARRRLNRALKRDLGAYFGESHYRCVPRKLIVEEMIPQCARRDYKILCCNGEPRLVNVITDRFIDVRSAMYDLEWSMLPLVWRYPGPDRPEPRPATLDLMLDYARRLAAPFRFARVDLYDVEGAIMFGEITFYPASGLDRIEPRRFDDLIGDMIAL